MPLEIKILDYGDIELESSFLVLGRDCGRTRRVLTLGFLITGGPYPVVVDTGYRSNQIMETLGMRGLQYHENMIENQLKRHGVRMGDVRYVLHTHLHIDHAGKDDLFPMNTTVVLNRKELEYSVSGLMHPQYPAPDIKHLIDRLRIGIQIFPPEILADERDVSFHFFLGEESSAEDRMDAEGVEIVRGRIGAKQLNWIT